MIERVEELSAALWGRFVKEQQDALYHLIGRCQCTGGNER